MTDAASDPTAIERRISDRLRSLVQDKDVENYEPEVRDMSARLLRDRADEVGNLMDRIVGMDDPEHATERRAVLERLWSEIDVVEGDENWE